MNTPIRKACVIALSSVLALNGCAFVDAKRENKSITKTIEENTKQFPKAEDSSNHSVVEFFDEPYFGTQTVPVAREKLLPPVFSNPYENPATLISGEGRVNLSTVAERITQYTGIPVDIDQNVFIRSASLPSNTNGASNNSAMPIPIVGGAPAAPANGGGQNQVANLAFDSERNIMLSYYKGPLAKFLDLVASRLSISWEFSDGKVRFFRYKTQTFEIKAIAGSKKVETNFSSTGEIASSSGTSGGSSDGGNSKTSLGVMQSQSATLNLWGSLSPEITSMISAGGKIAINEYSGTVTVTDTPQVLHQVGGFISELNRRISRTVYLQVDVYTVQDQKGGELGADIALNLSKGKYGFTSSSIPTLAQSSGGVGFSVTGTSMDGTKGLINALGTSVKITGHAGSNAYTINNNPVPFTMSLSQSYVDSIGSSQSQTSTSVTVSQKQITTGAFIEVIPRILDNNRMLLQYTVDLSDDPTFDVTTVSGSTLKSPRGARRATTQTVNIKTGETLVLTQMGRNTNSDKGNLGFLGASATSSANKETTLILITPVLMDGDS